MGFPRHAAQIGSRLSLDLPCASSRDDFQLWAILFVSLRSTMEAKGKNESGGESLLLVVVVLLVALIVLRLFHR